MDWTGRPALARRLGEVLAQRGEVAYCVEALDGARISGARAASRATPWMRFAGPFGVDSRLRAAKLLLPRNVRWPWRFAV
jgi:hypothetical protein